MSSCSDIRNRHWTHSPLPLCSAFAGVIGGDIVLGRVAARAKKIVYKVSIAEPPRSKPYRLGVYGPGSGIDTLCIVPKRVPKDFSDVFKSMSKEMDVVAEVLVTYRDSKPSNLIPS